ncbi:MAG: hypothetical protein ACRBFS_25820 [Aureispira sp.]
MKLLQEIPSGIQLQQERYEWMLSAQNREGSGWGRILLQSLVLLAIVLVEIFVLYRLVEIWEHAYRYNLWFYGFFYLAQAGLCIVVVKEIIYAMKESWRDYQTVLEVVLKNEGFELVVRNKTTQQTEQKWYDRTTIKEIFYNQGPSQKASIVKRSLLNVPQELFIRPKGAKPEAWGRFLKTEQTTFVALLLRRLYSNKEVDQQILLAPPSSIEDDFEDLSQHLIDE